MALAWGPLPSVNQPSPDTPVSLRFRHDNGFGGFTMVNFTMEFFTEGDDPAGGEQFYLDAVQAVHDGLIDAGWDVERIERKLAVATQQAEEES